MKKVCLILFLGLMPYSVFSAPELKGSPQELKKFLYPNDKIVVISAQAKEKAYSDKVVVTLVITTEDKLLSQSIVRNHALRKKISAALTQYGIAANSIKSSKFSSSPEYGWLGSRPSSYKVINRMTISITRGTHLTDIAVVADQYEMVELSDIAFEHTQKDEYNERVKAKALTKIIKQKEFYERLLGLKLTPVGVRDSLIRQRPTRGARVLEQALASGSQNQDIAASDDRLSIPEFSFDEVKYEANLSVDFRVEP